MRKLLLLLSFVSTLASGQVFENDGYVYVFVTPSQKTSFIQVCQPGTKVEFGRSGFLDSPEAYCADSTNARQPILPQEYLDIRFGKGRTKFVGIGPDIKGGQYHAIIYYKSLK